MIRANSFLGGKVYFRVDGEQTSSGIKKPSENWKDPNEKKVTLEMAEEMEDRNSWNGMIFRQIKARSDWLSALIWRKQSAPDEDITEKEDEDLGAKKGNLDSEDQRFIDWCDGRQENFNNLFIEEKLEKIEFVLGYLGFSKPDF